MSKKETIGCGAVIFVAFIAAVLSGIFGLGIGFIFCTFLQALGISIVFGTTAGIIAGIIMMVLFDPEY